MRFLTIAIRKCIPQRSPAPKHTALFTTVNLLLGVGPIIVPAPFFEAGFVLSLIWLVIILLMSYVSALYIAEAISKVSHVEYLNQERKSILSAQENGAGLSQPNTDRLELVANGDQNKVYDHLAMFEILYGTRWKVFPSVVISQYLLGVSISKCIITGKTLSNVFKEVPVLNTFELWLGVFFVSGALFSFKSIEKTKLLQAVIISVRMASVLLMIGGAIYIACISGVKNFTPKDHGVVNIDAFSQLFSNLVFSFLFHHSLPGIMSTLKNSSQVTFFIRTGFLIAGSTMVLVPITAIMAFGDQLGVAHSLKYYNYDFQGQLDFVYYFVSFYVFLNVAAFSVYIIIIRTNIMSMFLPQINPRTLSKQTALVSAVLLLIILTASYFLKDRIQVAISFTSGIFGGLILFYLPTLQVYKARIIHSAAINAPPRKDYYRFLPLLIIAIGTVLMGFNLYEIIVNLTAQQ